MTETTAVRFLTGVQAGDWHAVEDAENALICDWHAWAACGALVRTTKYGSYDRDSTPVTYGPCHLCAWTVAARTGTLDAELARLEDPVARRAAEDFLKAEGRPGEPDAPALMQLLAAVSDHAPVSLVSEECLDRDCEHAGGCPVDPACAACSLQAGSWAGEWEGTFRLECRITAPCAVLLTLSASAAEAVKSGA